jgi:hypothetical protein
LENPESGKEVHHCFTLSTKPYVLELEIHFDSMKAFAIDMNREMIQAQSRQPIFGTNQGTGLPNMGKQGIYQI